MAADPTITASRKFTFDTEFAGDVLPTNNVYKRLYTAEETERLVAAARAEGEATAMQTVEAQASRALLDLAVSTRAALPALAAAAHDHRVGAAELALAAARQIAGAACDRFPEAPLQAALTALSREVEATPKLVLKVAPEMLDRLQAALKQTADSIGYGGQIVAKAEPDLPPAAFVLEWGDGAAAFDPAEAAARVAEALEGALAAEGLHAEALIPLPPSAPTTEADHG